MKKITFFFSKLKSLNSGQSDFHLFILGGGGFKIVCKGFYVQFTAQKFRNTTTVKNILFICMRSADLNTEKIK